MITGHSHSSSESTKALNDLNPALWLLPRRGKGTLAPFGGESVVHHDVLKVSLNSNSVDKLHIQPLFYSVPMEHHPTIGDIISNRYLKVMFKIPNKGHLPTPVLSCCLDLVIPIEATVVEVAADCCPGKRRSCRSARHKDPPLYRYMWTSEIDGPDWVISLKNGSTYGTSTFRILSSWFYNISYTFLRIKPIPHYLTVSR